MQSVWAGSLGLPQTEAMHPPQCIYSCFWSLIKRSKAYGVPSTLRSGSVEPEATIGTSIPLDIAETRWTLESRNQRGRSDITWGPSFLVDCRHLLFLSLFPSFSFSPPSPSSIHPCLLLGYHLCLECMHMGSTGPVQLMYTAHWMYSQLTRIILDGYIYRQLPRQEQGRTKAMDIFL